MHSTKPLLVLMSALALLAAACGDDTDVTAGDDTTSTTSPDAPAAQTCDAGAYTLEYPEGWHTTDDDDCEWFNSEAFELPEATEATDIAVHVDHPIDVPFDDLVDDVAAGPEVADVLLEEELTIAGRDAARVETVSSGEALYPEGTRVYAYAVADIRSAVLLASTTSVAEGDYDENKGVLDEMMASLTAT